MDPIRIVESQYRESILAHRKMAKADCRSLEKEMLAKMHLTDPERVMVSYPFELSGGMKQRVGIAMSMTARPRLLLADEPTSALDVTIQAEVVREMKKLREQYETAIILVTHNMGVASYISDKIGVMCKGELVEFGKRDDVIFHPKHEYTKSLLAAVHQGWRENDLQNDTILLEVKNLNKTFPVKKEKLYAVSDVSFSLKKGECLRIVGESGCGKSTVARMIAGITPTSDGRFCWKERLYRIERQ